MTFSCLVGTHVQNVLRWALTVDRIEKKTRYKDMENSMQAIVAFPQEQMTQKDHEILNSMTKFLESKKFS